MTRERTVDGRSLDRGGVDHPRRLGAGRTWTLSRADVRPDDPVVLAPGQRSAIADQSRRYVTLRDLPRRRVIPAAPAESWRSAIAAYVGTVVAAIAWIIVLLAMTATDVDARAPSDRCLACRDATPRPTPIVVGIPPSATALPTLPPTDAE